MIKIKNAAEFKAFSLKMNFCNLKLAKAFFEFVCAPAQAQGNL